ncbi:protein kinase domain-containing protein [Sinanaerobacter sp. ZZT-01]|uniref:protein kinase domain-containing protein n=1 Tax=Sinanaerobacter sp. ZZT-01 TaxID=3111540 RepID=UPI002D77059D|nr:protein kinase [Sinanaerobacter sp. ZZT-01]WRR92788.1 protein kinase [Sinanaerobacter sp. ZZT-01]
MNNLNRYYKINETVNGYSILKTIGEGRYGIVYLAINDKDEKCIIKQLKKEMLEETRKKLFYEKQILQELDNPKFPKFISEFKDEYSEGYILEYIQGKVFEDLLAEDMYEFSKSEIYTICSQLLELVEILQDNNIVHRDIRLPNVIIKENKELALIDFGLARIIDNKRYVKEMDYWFLGDFLIHLYYSSYKETNSVERPWYEELDLTTEEKIFLKKLMGIKGKYSNIEEIKTQLENIKNMNRA